jgi:RibD C-terminal domain
MVSCQLHRGLQVYPNVPEIRRKDNPMNNDVAQISELGRRWVEGELVADAAANKLTDLIDGVRTAVIAHADWAETAHLVAEELRAHPPSPDALTAEQRLDSPDDAFAQQHGPGSGAEIIGAGKFGHPGWHFIDASPAEALETARAAADGKDVRIGGGPTVIRDFLAAGLVDHMHIVMVPILLGRGVRVWDGLEGLEKDYEVEATSSPSGVTHVTFTRADV